jgi:hypothetical protein
MTLKPAGRVTPPVPILSRKLSIAVALWGLMAVVSTAWAGEAIVTDRPDFVESSDVVGRGGFQIETGLSWERNKADGVKTRTVTTPTLLRIGVSDTLELRLESDGYTRSKTTDTATGTTLHERGYADASIGLKWRMQEGNEEHGTPGIAWLAHLDVDSGSRAFRGQGVRPSLRAVAEWELPQEFSVGVMPGVVVDKNPDGQRFVAGILAVTLGKSWTPKFRGFVELAGQQLASRKNGGSVVTFDTGVAYLVTDAVQVDVSVARGLTSFSPDIQCGVGVSIRF